jgi:hypothetical protein
MFLSTLVESVMCLHSVCKSDMYLSTLMSSVICVNFSQIVDHYVTYSSQGISYRIWMPTDEFVDHWCNLVYASK